MSEATYWVVVPAAGNGARMQAAQAKPYLPLGHQTVLDHTLTRLTTYTRFKNVVVVLASDDVVWPTTPWAKHPLLLTARGGDTRFHSVLNGLAALQTMAREQDWVLVHDAARPCVTHADLDALITTVGDDAVGGLLGVPVRDTMKRTTTQHRITLTEERSQLWHALTPQMFRFGVLWQALQQAVAKAAVVTDEAAAVELQGLQPLIVPGRLDNIKITYPNDIQLAAFYLKQQRDEKTGV